MAKLFFYKLKEWQSDRSIKRVLLIGDGKAFCAGGDLKSLFLSSEKSNLFLCEMFSVVSLQAWVLVGRVSLSQLHSALLGIA